MFVYPLRRQNNHGKALISREESYIGGILRVNSFSEKDDAAALAASPNTQDMALSFILQFHQHTDTLYHALMLLVLFIVISFGVKC